MPKGIKAVSVVPASELRIMPSEYFIGDMEADDVFQPALTWIQAIYPQEL